MDKSVEAKWVGDMEALTMRPGDTLVLRARRPMSREDLAAIRHYVDDAALRMGIRVLIVPPDFDMNVIAKAECDRPHWNGKT